MHTEGREDAAGAAVGYDSSKWFYEKNTFCVTFVE
jgi:hypothetical protein